MDAWYLSYNRFEKRITRQWDEKGFDWNRRHLNILPYAYRTLMVWSAINSKKISEKNKPISNPTLF